MTNPQLGAAPHTGAGADVIAIEVVVGAIQPEAFLAPAGEGNAHFQIYSPQGDDITVPAIKNQLVVDQGSVGPTGGVKLRFV